jgi:hypothetical protein
VEELFLSFCLGGKEMDVIENEGFTVSVVVAKGVEVPFLDCGDVVIDKGLGVSVDLADIGSYGETVGDGLEQMGFAKTRLAMDVKRVVVFAGILGNGDGCGVGDPGLGADNKVLESEIGVQGGLWASGRRRGSRVRSCGRGG